MGRSGQREEQAASQSFAFKLNEHSGVPVYRQLIDQVQAAMAAGALTVGSQLPTVRQVAVDLTINPNTVLRAIVRWRFAGCSTPSRGRVPLSLTRRSSIRKTNATGSWGSWPVSSSRVPGGGLHPQGVDEGLARAVARR
jgi:DNA-binding transcriptional MocR family regulator